MELGYWRSLNLGEQYPNKRSRHTNNLVNKLAMPKEQKNLEGKEM